MTSAKKRAVVKELNEAMKHSRSNHEVNCSNCGMSAYGMDSADEASALADMHKKRNPTHEVTMRQTHHYKVE